MALEIHKKIIADTNESTSLKDVEKADYSLEKYFEDKFEIDPSISRQLVSFQANKARPRYRWYKFKEAFSAALVEEILSRYGINRGRLLDPFAGSGTALFISSVLGIEADGIELLPIGQQIIETRLLLQNDFIPEDISIIRKWYRESPWNNFPNKITLNGLRITAGAYPDSTHDSIERYLAACEQENERVKFVLRFALLCILESISYTRKDGQYLRWDFRSGRRQGEKIFNKGKILEFNPAISNKIGEIMIDLNTLDEGNSLGTPVSTPGSICLFHGSCLEILPKLESKSYSVIMTSPPYCNRYDYTRTYALELALLGINENKLVNLRQEMLSCTVENREKDLIDINRKWIKPISIADEQELLQTILAYLEEQKALGKLNNNGIPRMVRGYFYEMACVIYECWRVLKPGAKVFMVNDNVRYAGIGISVDMILSSIAENLGFRIEKIIVLPNGKGNSSQQMGKHGRQPLRKCIYVWRKPGAIQ